MPFKITEQSFTNGEMTEDLCPYGCITNEETNGLKVDAELCTDCGACALACPGKFEYARAFTRCAEERIEAARGEMVGSTGGWDGVHEVPAVKVEAPKSVPVQKPKAHPQRYMVAVAR